MVTLASFKYALRGLKAVISSERNAKVHILFAVLALAAALLLRVSIVEMMFVLISIVLVFFAEIINTAMEKTLDLISQENNHLVQLIKDMLAAVVLLTAISAIVVAALVFIPHLWSLVLEIKK